MTGRSFMDELSQVDPNAKQRRKIRILAGQRARESADDALHWRPGKRAPLGSDVVSTGGR